MLMANKNHNILNTPYDVFCQSCRKKKLDDATILY